MKFSFAPIGVAILMLATALVVVTNTQVAAQGFPSGVLAVPTSSCSKSQVRECKPVRTPRGFIMRCTCVVVAMQGNSSNSGLNKPNKLPNLPNSPSSSPSPSESESSDSGKKKWPFSR